MVTLNFGNTYKIDNAVVIYQGSILYNNGQLRYKFTSSNPRSKSTFLYSEEDLKTMNVTPISYELGVVKGNSKKELGTNATRHCGLNLEDDSNVGKYFTFKNRVKGQRSEKVHKIVACQKMWGYDNNGKYTMIDGYRAVYADNEHGDFGTPIALYDIDFI